MLTWSTCDFRPRWVLCANHMEPVKGFLGRFLRRKLIEIEIGSRSRNPELVKIIDWIPQVWHHLNRFLEAHSSSDVTIGTEITHHTETNMNRLFPVSLIHCKSWTWVSCLFIQVHVCSCHVRWMWTVLAFGSLTCGTTPSSPTCWRRWEKAYR